MVLKFKIELTHTSDPPVWRRVLVPDSFSFAKFHLVIQAAFGWEHAHMYQFSPSGYGSEPQIGMITEDPWDEDDTIDSSRVKLSKVFKEKGQNFTYIYDFGDDWIHEMKLEEIIKSNSRKAELLAGKGACPPEDCGGPWGYKRMLEILADPQNEEHESMREWLGLDEGEVWDVNYFNLAGTQEIVSSI